MHERTRFPHSGCRSRASGQQMADHGGRDVRRIYGRHGHQRGQCVAASHDGQLQRGSVIHHLGGHQLQHRGNHHGYHGRLVEHPDRSQTALSGIFRSVYVGFHPLRHGHQLPPDADLPRHPGCGRRCADPGLPGHFARNFPPGRARHGHGPMGHGRGAGAGHRAHPGRLAHGSIRLALDLLHQRAGERCRHFDGGILCPRSALPAPRRQEGRLVGHRIAGRGADQHADRHGARPAGKLVRFEHDPIWARLSALPPFYG